MKTARSVLCFGAAMAATALLGAGPAAAHHSFAMFEPDKTVTLDATVESVEWSNPHIWINLIVKNAAGAPEKWGVEAGATNTMARFGWKRNSLTPGDAITAIVHPMKDGAHNGSLVKIVTADGKELVIGVQGARPNGVPGSGS
jgi:hypothetical protein